MGEHHTGGNLAMRCLKAQKKNKENPSASLRRARALQPQKSRFVNALAAKMSGGSESYVDIGTIGPEG